MTVESHSTTRRSRGVRRTTDMISDQAKTGSAASQKSVTVAFAGVEAERLYASCTSERIAAPRQRDCKPHLLKSLRARRHAGMLPASPLDDETTPHSGETDTGSHDLETSTKAPSPRSAADLYGQASRRLVLCPSSRKAAPPGRLEAHQGRRDSPVGRCAECARHAARARRVGDGDRHGRDELVDLGGARAFAD